MTNPYTRVNSWNHRLRQLGLTAALLGGATVAAQAQTLNYTVGATSNTTTTYTDLASTGTTILTANSDDANSDVQTIGFPFVFNGSRFTQFFLNTNGFIKLGSTAPTAAAMFVDEAGNQKIEDPFQSATDPYIIAPLNLDLAAGTAGGTEYRMSTTGTAPNRVCTIQWKNVQDKAKVTPTQFANISFQVRLYETTNVVELVYDTATPGTDPAGRLTQVGIKGSGFSTGQLVQLAKDPDAAWSAATPANFYSVSSTGQLNVLAIASVALPDAGRTFRFTPSLAPAKDIAIRAVYTLSKIAAPRVLPQPIRINIANLGTAAQSNINITLSITGANTLTTTVTLPTLAAGAGGPLTIANLPATLNPGTNVITVSVADDQDNTNNSVSVTQLVTPDRLSYIDPSKDASQGFSGYGNSSTVFAVKYNVPGTVVPTDAKVSFAASDAASPYQVLVYDATGGNGLPGKILYTSALLSRPAAASTATVPLPALQLTGGSFYIGVREASNAGITIATQSENPSRTGTFLFSPDGNIGWVDMAVSYPRRLAIEVGLAPTPTCAAPTALAVTSTTPTTADVTFTPAASGTSSYQLIYGPVGFQPATGGTTVTATGSPATLTGLQPGANYQLYVQSVCTAGGNSLLTGPVAFSTSCNSITSISTFPYSEGFENVATGLPCGITFLDANADGATWRVSTENPNSGINSIRYNGIVVSNVAADDWFFTPALTLAPATTTTRYQVAFRYRTSGVGATATGIESLEVKSGTAATVASQTNLLYTNAAITNTTYLLANGTSTPAVALLPAGAGTRFVGFHIKSAANQGNLYIDDVSVTAVTVTATTSEALLRAVTVFPNPSTGVFELAIQGANAKGNLGILVTNTLGQQVYTGNARDNYTTKLDLSNLAAGLYHLQVRNGDETMTRQIAIVK
ncbi:choice-of-anchor J domain-containing protein [Hymenobacter sp. H14-R3]|uniref:T9SS-dependent choice-of-anchor J family protein n=1 Tax=Hymenobacter sp. H14-R3 TaxID=3046308 RepID=UPI0024BA6EAC|nr:choice-of-anchor J domain-containing protein [Hymenobacter sp. H14-R3]MDJ0363518.1 choice-of-anchor J domain-containing protein [Hymenobacter sp. H14-R3]